MRKTGSTVLILMLLASLGSTEPATSAQASSINVELSLDKARYCMGETVEITLKLTNQGRSKVAFEFNNGQMYDFALIKGGQVVWQWSHGRVFVQALTTLSFEPGEVRIFRERWTQKNADGALVQAGEYEMVALFPVRGGPPGRPGADSPRVPLRISCAAGKP